VAARRRQCSAVTAWSPKQGCEDGWRKVLGELDQCGGAGRPDGDVVGGQAPSEGDGGGVLAGAGAGEAAQRRSLRSELATV
jgi:hypothetical protein